MINDNPCLSASSINFIKVYILCGAAIGTLDTLISLCMCSCSSIILYGLQGDIVDLVISQVFECLHPTTVVVLTSRPSQEHFSPHVVKSDPFCMLRCLQSSSWCHSPLVPTFLEPPNTIAGEAAASE